ncbi:MAG: radical SAM protein [Thermoanaerobaculia bacterium]|nr:radical SAM protein [Thermoanaerobaculia bacterium]
MAQPVPTPSERRRVLLAAERETESLSRHGRTRVALGFPNSYEIGMSNLGFQWVYRLLNREENIACDRFFADEDADRRGPRTLETDTPLGDFPLVAFSISWEMDYVNFLRLLPAARIPLDRTERGEGDPIVLVGGDCARINPAPLAAWVDVFAMGDAEKIVPSLADVLRRDLTRDATLAALADLKGLYVPAVHGARAEGAEDGKIVVQQFKAGEGALREPPHTTLLTPHTELSDKLLIEIARGCSEMCRFCWAAYAMAPQVRVTADAVLEIAKRNRPLTSRAGLIATAVADHPEILPILRGLAGLGYHIALSSVKIDAISEEILAILTKQGEHALAIAPEAGNERLRRAINKKVSDEMLFDKVRLIARSGITQLKLYLQVGLPGETDGDVDDVVGLVDALRLVFLEEGRKLGRVGTLVPTVNAFIPKPHTPFENEPLDDPAALTEKMKRLSAAFWKMPNVTFRGMPVVEAIWEAYLAKMGPESAPILLEAAAGAPVRRLVKTHRDTLMAVVRPGRALALAEHESPRGVFDPHARQAAPWGFIAKS